MHTLYKFFYGSEVWVPFPYLARVPITLDIGNPLADCFYSHGGVLLGYYFKKSK